MGSVPTVTPSYFATPMRTPVVHFVIDAGLTLHDPAAEAALIYNSKVPLSEIADSLLELTYGERLGPVNIAKVLYCLEKIETAARKDAECAANHLKQSKPKTKVEHILEIIKNKDVMAAAALTDKLNDVREKPSQYGLK